MKARTLKLAAREAAQTAVEKEMVRVIEQNRGQSESLESQIAALQFERARLNEVHGGHC